MTTNSIRSRTLGRRIRLALGDAPRSTREEEHWAEFEAAWRAGAQPTRRAATWWIAGAAAAGVLALLGGLLASRRGSERTAPRAPDPAFVIEQGTTRTEGHAGARLMAPEQLPLRVRFAGGSELILSPRGRAQIGTARPDAVRCRLEAGQLEVAVVKAPGTAWVVEAGPYRVSVVGTRFTVDWSAARQAITVRVANGRVRLSGPGLAPSGALVDAGRTLSVDQGHLAVGTPYAGGAPGAASAPAVGATDPAAVKVSPPLPAPVRGSTQAPEPTRAERWQRLAEAGSHAEIRREAQAAGLLLQLGSVPLSELWLLADACRYAGQPDEGALVLEAIRSRVPGTEAARRAAFLLGRYHAEGTGRPAVACDWFLRYLLESPEGPLVAEALGRSMETCSRAGRREPAERAARSYLVRFPAGPYRRLAESLRGGRPR